MTLRPEPSFILSLIKLTRLGNLVIIGLAQYFTAGFLVEKKLVADPKLLLLSVSTVLIAAAGYIINDYYDIKIDLINKPGRVVVGKSITRRIALFFHIFLSGTGILIGFFLSLWIGLTNLFCAFLLWFYSNYLKRQPFIGNFSIALLTLFSIGVVSLLYPGHHTWIIVYAVFAFLITLIREIIKDMEDLKGDNTFGCRTLPIIWGIRGAKRVIYLILLLFSFLLISVAVYFPAIPLPYFLFLLALLLLFTLKLKRADTVRDYAKLSLHCKFIMLLGIISMALHG